MSYFYVPVVVFAMTQVIKQGYDNGFGKTPQVDLLAFQAVPIMAMGLFVFSYLMAILNRHNRELHKRYMIANGIAMIAPAMGRINFSWLGITGMGGTVLTSFAIPTLVVLGFLINDRLKKRPYNAYLLSFCFFAFVTIFYAFFTKGVVWQTIAKTIFE